ncbi:MAG: phosphopantetheine-binding protein [Bacteroidales bacterium]
MDTLEKLQQLLLPILGLENREEVKPESALVRDLGAESIDFVEIFYEIENQFGVKIKVQEIAQSDYGNSEGSVDNGKISAETAAKLNADFNSDRFVEGLTIRELFETFTVRDLATIIDRKRSVL